MLPSIIEGMHSRSFIGMSFNLIKIKIELNMIYYLNNFVHV